MASLFSDLLIDSLELGQEILSRRPDKQRKAQGQFLTPIPVARFMAKQLGEVTSSSRILEPAIGSGVLVCAVIEQIAAKNQPCEIWLDGYETDEELCEAAKKIVTLVQERVAKYGITIHSCIQNRDFILDNVPVYQPHLLLAEGSKIPGTQTLYDYIIANPPYFKLNRKDPRAEVASGQIRGHTNIYTLFLALSATKLVLQGKACFIVPRSFCSGAYFSALRQELMEKTVPYALHLFESREAAFKDDAVLQENIIISFSKKKSERTAPKLTSNFNISTSKGVADLEKSLLYREVSLEKFLGRRNGTLFFRLPTGELDEQIIDIVDGWPRSHNELGFNVSTGPVVPFRSRSSLTDSGAVQLGKAVPLLWMHNVKRQKVDWPALNGSKPQGLYLSEEAKSLSIPMSNYVLLRRFSAKEEQRRLIAAPFLENEFSHYETIGLENHLNYIYRKRGQLSKLEAVGLAALLNSALIDRYFRITNGNTQVNATELRALPLPLLEVIQTIGQVILKLDTTDQEPNLESIVFTTLPNSGLVPLLELYQKRRQHHRIPLTLSNGEEYHLSPGLHNELQVAVIEEFGPRFAPGATLLYLGDTENKTLIFDKQSFEELNIPTSSHDKLPDIVLYDEERNWLFLIEAVTSHGPVSPKRYVELENMLTACSAGRIYVSAFLDFATPRLVTPLHHNPTAHRWRWPHKGGGWRVWDSRQIAPRTA